MDLMEYQGKQIFASSGVPVPEGKVASGAKRVRQIAEAFGAPVVIKAQVKVGGRGKAGGVKLAKTPEEAAQHAESIIGMDIKGHKVRKVLVERAGDIAAEYYASFMLDRGAKAYLGMCSAKGGMDIEAVAANEPDYLAKVHIDPLIGIRAYHVTQLVVGGKIPREHQIAVGGMLTHLFRVFVESDASLVEVNPLVITGAGDAVALDAKVSLDESALFRHPEWERLIDHADLPKQERMAKESGIGTFVKLDGNVGVIGNGAGLTMSTLDVVASYGGKPANFLDIGGGANAEVMARGIEIILSDRKVKSLLVNIFGGITRCDEVARGILAAVEQLGGAKVPIVVRLDGTNAEEARAILKQASVSKVEAAQTMNEAAERAVRLTKRGAA
jgi:succinyl-CoA synthetase beta subunit